MNLQANWNMLYEADMQNYKFHMINFKINTLEKHTVGEAMFM